MNVILKQILIELTPKELFSPKLNWNSVQIDALDGTRLLQNYAKWPELPGWPDWPGWLDWRDKPFPLNRSDDRRCENSEKWEKANLQFWWDDCQSWWPVQELLAHLKTSLRMRLTTGCSRMSTGIILALTFFLSFHRPAKVWSSSTAHQKSSQPPISFWLYSSDVINGNWANFTNFNPSISIPNSFGLLSLCSQISANFNPYNLHNFFLWC